MATHSAWCLVILTVTFLPNCQSQIPSLPSLNTDLDLGIFGMIFDLPFLAIDLSCINTTLILDSVDCFMAPFGLDLETLLDMENEFIHMSPYATDPKSTSRTLLNEQGDDNMRPALKNIHKNIQRFKENIETIEKQIEKSPEKLRQQVEGFKKVVIHEMTKMANTRDKIKVMSLFDKELTKGMKRVDINKVVVTFLSKVADKLLEMPLLMKNLELFGLSQMSKQEYDYYSAKQAEDIFGVNFLPDEIKAIICGISDELCTLINIVEDGLECLHTYPRDAFEDGLTWMSCFYRCDNIRVMSRCMSTAWEPCDELSWIGPVMIKAITEYFKLGHCGPYKMVSPENKNEVDEINEALNTSKPFSYVIDEGGETQNIVVLHNYHPMAQCVDFGAMETALGALILFGRALANLLFGYKCQVNMHVWLTNYIDALSSQRIVVKYQFLTQVIEYGEPLCRSQFLVSQAKIGSHDYGKSSDNQCEIIITKDNWETEFVFPVKATVDHKPDGDQTAYFTVKQVIDGFHKSTALARVLVRDHDPNPDRSDMPLNQLTCQSTNDPHIVTFDGHYYNNFYHGYFILYRHKTLPYEVQVLYQACGPTLEVSCNCAVAVRSGDDVIVFDRCAKEDDYCDPFTGFCGNEDNMNVRVYINDELTIGTQVFQQFDGHKWEVLLPHGQIVRVSKDNHEHMLNVMIQASVYDLYNRTEGLCGGMDGETGMDLIFRNETAFEGEGSEIGGQPGEFIEDWRAYDDELIFSGTGPQENVDVMEYCRCHQILLLGTHCVCEDNIVETCDLKLEGEITDLVGHIGIKSSNTPGGLEAVIYDEDYVPEPLPSWDNLTDWTENQAENACKDYIRDSLNGCHNEFCPLIGSCTPFEIQTLGCMDDIRLTNELEEWGATARDAAKYHCLDRLSRDVNGDEEKFDTYYNTTCPFDCSGNGICENATCVCNEDFVGAICSVPVDTVPSTRPADYPAGETTVYCDTRRRSCLGSDVFGINFADSDEITCVLEEISVTSNNVPSQTGKTINAPSWLMTPNQLFCIFPTVGDWMYSILWERGDQNEIIQERVFFISYDSVCYTCDDNKCSLKQTDDYCLINNECYAPDEKERPKNSDDTVEECHICNPEYSTDKFDYMRTEECDVKYNEMMEAKNKQNRDDRLKLIMSIMLSATILLAATILYACYGNKLGIEERKRFKEKHQNTPKEK